MRNNILQPLSNRKQNENIEGSKGAWIVLIMACILGPYHKKLSSFIGPIWPTNTGY